MFSALGSVQSSSLLRIHFKGSDNHKAVSGTKADNEWHSKVLKLEKICLGCKHSYAPQLLGPTPSLSLVDSSRDVKFTSGNFHPHESPILPISNLLSKPL